MYRDILVATDGSEGGQRAADHGLGLARALDSTLHVLAVLDEGVTTRDQLRADLEGEAEDAINYVKDVGDEKGVAVTTEIRKGDPCDTIIDYANERDAELIIMGTTTGGRIDRLLHGSVTQCVSKRATVPVMSIGEETEPVFDAPEDAAFRFHCARCDSTLTITAETKEALAEKGCIICGAEPEDGSFTALEGK